MSHRYTVAKARALAARLLDRAAWYSSGAVEHTRVAVRRRLARCGLPIQKEYLQLACARGNEASGLFSEFAAVLGAVHHFEQHREIYAGLAVDFGVDGLYYEPALGPNWWEYFFEPIRLGDPADARSRRVPLWQHDAFAEGIETQLTRHSAADIVRRWVRARQPLLDDINDYCEANFGARGVIGVHYRGTDKHEEAAPVDYQVMIDAIHRAMNGEQLAVFIATDDAAFLNQAARAFHGDVLFRDARRSTDGAPVHKTEAHGYRKGYEAVIDCYLLSRCARIVRTSSNLSLVSTFINPAIPVEVISDS